MDSIYSVNNIYTDPEDISYFQLSGTKYHLRKSDSKFNTLGQRRIIESFTEERGLFMPPMSKGNTIEETASGTECPFERFICKLKFGSVLCLSNLDRVLKTTSLNHIDAVHSVFIFMGICILLANEKEYSALVEISDRIDGKRNVLDKYIEFVSDRMNESLGEINASKSASKLKAKVRERKDLRRYCRSYLRRIKDAFRETDHLETLDFRLWIVACFSGHLINKYLRDT